MQCACRNNSKEVGKCAGKKSSKELSKCECKKRSKDLGKSVCKKVARNKVLILFLPPFVYARGKEGTRQVSMQEK